MNNDQVIQEIYEEALAIVRDGFQYTDFVGTLGIIMRLCQLRQDLKGKGAEKKSVAMAVFKLIATESGILTPDEAEMAGTFMVTTLPSLIDTLKSIARDIAQATGAHAQKGLRWCCF